MACTEAQHIANQANSLHSTGPKTEAGKKICRQNAVVHGLTGEGVALPEAMRREIETLVADLAQKVPPEGPFEVALIEVIALSIVRMKVAAQREIECEDLERRSRVLNWDQDHDVAAADLGAKLDKRPERIAPRLERTSHGCWWLRIRWNALDAGVSGDACTWTDSQTEMALDLQAWPRADRDLFPQALDFRAVVDRARAGEEAALSQLRALTREQLDRLERHAQELYDESETPALKRLANGQNADLGPEPKYFRKLYAAAERSYERNWDLLKQLQEARRKALEPPQPPQSPGLPQSAAPGGLRVGIDFHPVCSRDESERALLLAQYDLPVPPDAQGRFTPEQWKEFVGRHATLGAMTIPEAQAYMIARIAAEAAQRLA